MTEIEIELLKLLKDELARNDALIAVILQQAKLFPNTLAQETAKFTEKVIIPDQHVIGAQPWPVIKAKLEDMHSNFQPKHFEELDVQAGQTDSGLQQKKEVI